MSTISAGLPAVIARAERRLQILAAAGMSFCFLTLNTLHLLAINLTLFSFRQLQGSPIIFFYYGAGLLIGGFLLDYFNPWILLFVTVGTSGMLTITFPLISGSLDGFLLIVMVSLDGIAWLAAAKLIKKHAVSPTQQQLWWILLAACSSSNIVMMISDSLTVNETIADIGQASFYVIGLIAILLLIAARYKKHQSRITQVSKVEFTHPWYKTLFILAKSCNFWFIFTLNNVLWAAKFIVFSFIAASWQTGVLQGIFILLLIMHYTILKVDDVITIDIKLMGLSGEVGIIVIGSLSTWLTHRRFIQVKKIIIDIIIYITQILLYSIQRKILLNIILVSLSTFFFMLGSPIITLYIDENNTQPRVYAPLLISFFIGMTTNGLTVLINWRMMELIPETLFGRILAFVTIFAPAGIITVNNRLAPIHCIICRDAIHYASGGYTLYAMIGVLCWSYGGTSLPNSTLYMYMLTCTAVIMWPFVLLQNFVH